MPDQDTIFTILTIIAFFLGVILIVSGFADLGKAFGPDILSNPLDSLSIGGTGTLKVVVGVVLTIAVIAPSSLRVIFKR